MCTIAQWTEKYFSKNIFVAEFSAHEKRFAIAAGPTREYRWPLCPGRLARVREGTADISLPAGSATPRTRSLPRDRGGGHSNQLPGRVGSCGLTGARLSLLCPSWWPDGPHPRLAEGPRPFPSGPLPAAQVLLSFLDLKTHVDGQDYIRSFPSHARFLEHLMWSLASITKWSFKEWLTVKTLWLILSTPLDF